MEGVRLVLLIGVLACVTGWMRSWVVELHARVEALERRCSEEHGEGTS